MYCFVNGVLWLKKLKRHKSLIFGYFLIKFTINVQCLNLSVCATAWSATTQSTAILSPSLLSAVFRWVSWGGRTLLLELILPWLGVSIWVVPMYYILDVINFLQSMAISSQQAHCIDSVLELYILIFYDYYDISVLFISLLSLINLTILLTKFNAI